MQATLLSHVASVLRSLASEACSCVLNACSAILVSTALKFTYVLLLPVTALCTHHKVYDEFMRLAQVNTDVYYLGQPQQMRQLAGAVGRLQGLTLADLYEISMVSELRQSVLTLRAATHYVAQCVC
jgi:hypothetical protein